MELPGRRTGHRTWSHRRMAGRPPGVRPAPPPSPRASTSTRAHGHTRTDGVRGHHRPRAWNRVEARRRRLPPPTHHVPGPAAPASSPYRHTVRAHTRTRSHSREHGYARTRNRAARPASSSFLFVYTHVCRTADIAVAVHGLDTDRPRHVTGRSDDSYFTFTPDYART